jgi:pimeloyl-ACP methyl ester carboxylesterase
MNDRVVLLSSPLLGPRVWRPVQAALEERGQDVTTSPTSAGAHVVTAEEVLDEFLESIPVAEPVVLVAHSNAGLYVPLLLQERVVTTAVFVDAGLPARAGRTPLAPPQLVSFLRDKADPDGILPAWTRWWDDESVAELFPSVDVRHEVELEQRRLPLTYFTGSLPIPAGWDAGTSAYLAFGDTYATERDDAVSRGWVVRTLPGGHLHMLDAPEEVAAAIVDLVEVVGLRRS